MIRMGTKRSRMVVACLDSLRTLADSLITASRSLCSRIVKTAILSALPSELQGSSFLPSRRANEQNVVATALATTSDGFGRSQSGFGGRGGPEFPPAESIRSNAEIN